MTTAHCVTPLDGRVHHESDQGGNAENATKVMSCHAVHSRPTLSEFTFPLKL